MLHPFGPEQASARSAQLLAHFGSIFAVLAAAPREQRRVVGSDQALLDHLRAMQGAVLASARDEVLDGGHIAGIDALARYLRLDLGYAPHETSRALFLSSRNRLLADDMLGSGSVTAALLPVRAIVHRALDLGAAGVILVHNHPSGDPEPSPQDTESTRLLAAACRALDLLLLDHIVVARGGWSSFRARGLL